MFPFFIFHYHLTPQQYVLWVFVSLGKSAESVHEGQKQSWIQYLDWDKSQYHNLWVHSGGLEQAHCVDWGEIRTCRWWKTKVHNVIKFIKIYENIHTRFYSKIVTTVVTAVWNLQRENLCPRLTCCLSQESLWWPGGPGCWGLGPRTPPRMCLFPEPPSLRARRTHSRTVETKTVKYRDVYKKVWFWMIQCLLGYFDLCTFSIRYSVYIKGSMAFLFLSLHLQTFQNNLKDYGTRLLGLSIYLSCIFVLDKPNKSELFFLPDNHYSHSSC